MPDAVVSPSIRRNTLPTTVLVAPAGRARRPDDRLPRHRPRPRSPGHPRRLRQADREPRGQTTRPSCCRSAPTSPPAESVPIAEAEELLAAGDDQTLMEHVVEIADKAGADVDVLIVEGMNPEPGMVHSTRVNALMLKALDAELVLVAAPARARTPTEVAETIAIAARGYGALAEGRQVGCILNRVCIGAAGRQAESETIGAGAGRLRGLPGRRAVRRDARPRTARRSRPRSSARSRSCRAASTSRRRACSTWRRRSRRRVAVRGRDAATRRVSDVGRLRRDRAQRAEGDAAGHAHHHARRPQRHPAGRRDERAVAARRWPASS